jgi:hypothetical protein
VHLEGFGPRIVSLNRARPLHQRQIVTSCRRIEGTGVDLGGLLGERRFGTLAQVLGEETTPREPFSDGLVEALEDEWRQVAQPRVDVQEWRSEFDKLVGEYGEIRARGAWVSGRADFMGILGLGRAELIHSAMLAWILDPEGRHGFGRRFLDQIVSSHIPDLDPATFRVWDVQREVQQLETRADIIVWGDSTTIVIEVKVDAGEGPRQCDRLYQRFSDTPDPKFVFLTPSGRPPITATGNAVGAFVPVSFADVREILQVVLAEGSNGDGVGVATDYLQTLSEEF